MTCEKQDYKFITDAGSIISAIGRIKVDIARITSNFDPAYDGLGISVREFKKYPGSKKEYATKRGFFVHELKMSHALEILDQSPHFEEWEKKRLREVVQNAATAILLLNEENAAKAKAGVSDASVRGAE